MVEPAHVLVVRGGLADVDRAENLLQKALKLFENAHPELHSKSLMCKVELLMGYDKFQHSETLYLQLLKEATGKDGADDISVSYILPKLTSLHKLMYREEENNKHKLKEAEALQ